MEAEEGVDVCSVAGTTAGAMPGTSVRCGREGQEHTGGAGGLAGSGAGVVVVRMASRCVEGVEVEPTLEHRAAMWVR